MIDRSAPNILHTGYWRYLRWVALAAIVPASWACVSRTFESPTTTPTATETSTVTQKINNNIDILFMVDNSSSMTSMQQKLLAQLPTFMQVLQNLPTGLPNLHVAVVSSDMGAPSDSDIGCTLVGDDGAFHYQPEGSCNSTTLTAGSTFISDVSGMANFTNPIGTVFQCIALLGASGCGFEHQLASIDRALGADGAPPPASAANFLRPDAYLGIVMLTNEDDASAPPNTTIFSLNGSPQNITNPDGPLANYRQNGGPRGTHLCQDPTSANPTAFITEPLLVPPDHQGPASAPTLNLTNCKDNDSGSSAFTLVSKFISDIKALKPDPDGQILVGGIIAPTTPVEVGWYPPVAPPPSVQAGELWPDEMHSCGAQGGDRVSSNATQFTTDGSFGDPGIRLSQFINAFPNSVQASICDPSYASSMTAIATKLGALIKPSCIKGQIQNDPHGQPECSVVNHLTDNSANTIDVVVPNCNENGGGAPCWTLTADQNACPSGGVALKLTQDATSMNAASLNSSIECSLCLPGSNVPGC